MSSQTQWSAFVYSRRYQVDFYTIAMPDDFNAEKKAWAEQFILTTTRQAEQLPGQPRWIMIRDREHCLFGVTCTASDLLAGDDPEVIDHFTHDFQGRPLYLFVGYVAQLSEPTELLWIPGYEGRDLKLFRSLYRFVERTWKIQDYEAPNQPRALSYKQTFEAIPRDDTIEQLARQMQTALDQITHELSEHGNYAIICPDSEETKQGLWKAIAHARYPVSLYLGAPQKADFRDSLFVCGTAIDVTEQSEIIRNRLDDIAWEECDRALEQSNPKQRRSSRKTKPQFDLAAPINALVHKATEDIGRVLDVFDVLLPSPSESHKIAESPESKDPFELKYKEPPPTRSAQKEQADQNQKDDWF